MMRISTKGRYALRIMLDLAQSSQKGAPVALREVAERQNITIKYMESIISRLLKDKLVSSVRGKAGGYALTRKPEEYNVYEILTAAEGDMLPVPCLNAAKSPCPMKQTCSTVNIWQGLGNVIQQYLESVTLDTLMQQKDGQDCCNIF